MFKKKLLVIDDTEFMVRFISDVLTEAGYDVISAQSGEEGLQKVREEKPDLVILDIVMPGMDGFEVCKVLRNDESNNLMPIIMLTTQGDEDDKLTGLELGADDYVTKPFNRKELLSRVRNTLIRIDRNRWANPLTGLQGNLEIQSEINRRIAKKEIFAVIYADLDNFKAYNDVYGFMSGDRAIKLTADVITDAVHMCCQKNDFVGHIGGDDFVVISVLEHVDQICNNIIKEFDRRIISLYNEEDIKKSYIVAADRRGKISRFPIMTISIAVVSNEHKEFINHLHVGELAAELKKVAKAQNKSNYIVDRRKNS